MAANFKTLTDFFVEIGAAEVGHTEKSYLAHVIGVYNDLKEWGCDEPLCRAAMFHSVYGTQQFQKFALPVERRDKVRELIGERPERLAYINCAMDRETFDRAVGQTEESYVIRDRLTGESIEMSQQEFEDLMRIHLCDWLEQVPRAQKWDYRRDAYRHMAARLGGVAQAAFERVFAFEETPTNRQPV